MVGLNHFFFSALHVSLGLLVVPVTVPRIFVQAVVGTGDLLPILPECVSSDERLYLP